MKVIINTGRTVQQGSYVDRKNCREYGRETSTIRLNPLDLITLGIMDGEHVRATGDGRSVILKSLEDETIEPGYAFIPLGPYANFLVGGETHGTGMPDFKSSTADIEGTDEEISDVADLMGQIGGMPYRG